MTTFWSIKHIETDGIQGFEGDVAGAYAKSPQFSRLHRFEKIGKDCFRTREEAVSAGLEKLQNALDATKRRAARIRERMAKIREVK